MNDHLSAHLAHENVSLQWSSLGDGVEREARRRILDAIGCALRAEGEATVAAVRRYGQGRPTAAHCQIWGTTSRSDPETAALLNGVATRALDLNDAYFGLSGLHPSDCLPGLIAVSEARETSWGEVLLAAVVAYEASIGLCDQLALAEHGWDHVNLISIGACLGIGRLSGLAPEQMQHALSLTLVPHAAMRQTRVGTISMWKDYAAADAVRQAVYACELAAAGVTGPALPFTGRQGLFAQLLEVPEPTQMLTEAVLSREPTQILRSHIKVWPLGYVAQAAVEAAQALRARVSVEDIDHVRILTYGQAVYIMADEEKWGPTTRGTADHSLPYVVSEMLVRGTVDEESFQPERFLDSESVTFMKTHMSVQEDEAYSRRYPAEFPVRVEATLRSGQIVEEEVAVPMGHADRPLSDTELSRKFHVGADRVIGEARAALLEDMVMTAEPDQRISPAAMALTIPQG